MNTRINIAVLVPYRVFPARMGGQKCIVLLYKYLRQLHSLRIISTEDNDPSATEGIPSDLILKKSKLRYLDLFSFFRIKKIIKEHQINCLILEHPYLGWLGLLLKWSTGIKLIIHSHNIEGLRFKSMGKWWWGLLWNYERWIHRMADHNYFITDHDLKYAIRKFKLKESQCSLITYGIEQQQPPAPELQQQARQTLLARHQIPEENKLILFNGTLSYSPNTQAIRAIRDIINPFLASHSVHPYTLLICGKDLPAEFNGLKGLKNVVYAGFVEDIDTYFLGSDIFINPVIEGGGIKTKLVEALALGLTCISTEDGAIGIPASVYRDQLSIVPNADLSGFNQKIIESLGATKQQASVAFFDHFYWGKIAQQAGSALVNLLSDRSGSHHA